MDRAALTLPERFPRACGYDPEWVARLNMGPHPLWQLEDLLIDLPLLPGQHVLDLGSGRGATSVFLAREYAVTVDAIDHWVPAAEAAATFDEAGVADRVTAINADITSAALAEETYDAIISIDAWEYFGTNTYFLHRLLPALRPGGRLGFTTPALRDDPYDRPVHPLVEQVVGWEVAAWHPARWWRRHTEITGELAEVTARVPSDSLELWLRWERATKDGDDALIEMLQALSDEATQDEEEPALGIVHVCATKPAA